MMLICEPIPVDAAPSIDKTMREREGQKKIPEFQFLIELQAGFS